MDQQINYVIVLHIFLVGARAPIFMFGVSAGIILHQEADEEGDSETEEDSEVEEASEESEEGDEEAMTCT